MFEKGKNGSMEVVSVKKNDKDMEMKKKKNGKVVVFFVVLFFMAALQPVLGESEIFDQFGIKPGQIQHGAVPEENIDLFTGNLTLRFKDIVLPGPNGFDLVIWRVYNSKIIEDYRLGTVNPLDFIQPGLDWLGLGWSMHMGRLQIIDYDETIIEFPDGRREIAYSHDSASWGIWYTRSFNKLVFEDNLYKLYLKNGTVWIFGTYRYIPINLYQSKRAYLVTEIINSFGHSITIEYNDNSATIKRITDSMNRNVNFVVDNEAYTAPVLKKIQVKNATGSTVDYEYTVTNYSDHWIKKLDRFDPPELPESTFIYYNDPSWFNFELKEYSNGIGGTCFYFFDIHIFYYDYHPFSTIVLSKKQIQFSPGDNKKTWEYSYPSYQYYYDRTVTVSGPVYNTKVTYFARTSDSQVEPKEDHWKTGLIEKESATDGSVEVIYDWEPEPITVGEWTRCYPGYYPFNIGKIKGPLIKEISTDRLGDSDSKEEYLYERTEPKKYGLPTKIKYYAGAYLSSLYCENYTAIEYFFEDSSIFSYKYMFTPVKKETSYSRGGTKFKEMQTGYYTGTSNCGAIDYIKRWNGSRDLTWDYTYSSSGADDITITIDLPENAGTEIYEYSYGILSEIRRPGYTIPELSRSISEHNSAILSETNRHGGFLEFVYDDLGRIERINMPSGFNDIVVNWATTSVGISQGSNALTKYWDGMGRDTGYQESGDGISLYFLKYLDAEGRVTTESKGSTSSSHKYSYVLNAAGNPINIIDPLGKITSIEYSANQKTVIDAE
ncbi:MAG: hypothetical protein KAT34_09870, partial [Candidatus Aminicenantes bacterium]|nr:hypothetical protein [Candidatus Aminicenantes bacterium]